MGNLRILKVNLRLNHRREIVGREFIRRAWTLELFHVHGVLSSKSLAKLSVI
jgi:hypothetical protein